MVATKRKTVPEEQVAVGAAPTQVVPNEPQPQEAAQTRAPQSLRQEQNKSVSFGTTGFSILNQGRVEAGQNELTLAEKEAIIKQRQAQGIEVDQAVLDQLEAEKQALAQQALESGAINPDSPEKSAAFTFEQDLTLEPTKINGVEIFDPELAPIVTITKNIPGFREVFQSVQTDQGFSKKQLEEIQRLNPERGKELIAQMMVEVGNRRQNAFIKRSIDKLGVLIEGVPVVSQAASYLRAPTPQKKINDINAELGKTDTYLDSALQLSASRPTEALDRINEKEQQLLELEAKLQLLVLESASVQQDPDSVNNVIQQITISYQKLNRARDIVALQMTNPNFAGTTVSQVQDRNFLRNLKDIAEDLNNSDV